MNIENIKLWSRSIASLKKAKAILKTLASRYTPDDVFVVALNRQCEEIDEHIQGFVDYIVEEAENA